VLALRQNLKEAPPNGIPEDIKRVHQLPADVSPV
jgi:hypothetical protein